MAKDILETVAGYLAEKGADAQLIKLIEDQGNSILELSNAVKFNYLKNVSDNDIKILVAGKDQKKHTNDLEERFNALYLEYVNMSTMTTTYIANLITDVSKLNKKVIRNRWEQETKNAVNNLGRLSNFKGPIQTLNKEDLHSNWVGLQNEPEWVTDTPTEGNFFDDVLSYSDGADPEETRHGEKGRRWLYIVDHSYNTPNVNTETKGYGHPAGSYSNKTDTSYQSELRFKGFNVLGLIDAFDAKTITLGDKAGLHTINIDGDLEVFQELKILGTGIKSDEIGLACVPNAGFLNNVNISKQLLFNTSGKDSEDNVITSSIDANLDISTQKKLLGQGLTIDPINLSSSEIAILLNHSLDFGPEGSNNIRFGSTSSGIYFGAETTTNPAFYKNGHLYAKTDIKTKKVLTNVIDVYSSSGVFSESDNRVFRVARDGDTSIIGGTFKITSPDGENKVFFSQSYSKIYNKLLCNDELYVSEKATFSQEVEINKTLECSNGITVGPIDIGVSQRDRIVCSVFDGVATQAKYADVAENYKIMESDIDKLVPGTVVSLSVDNNKSEIELYDSSLPLAGVISTNPGYLLNSKDQEDKDYDLYIAVALTGRVPVKTKDNIKKGMYVLPSKNSSGYVTGYSKSEICNLSTMDKFEIIGVALSDSKNGIVEIKM